MKNHNFSFFKGGIIEKVPKTNIHLKDFIDIVKSNEYKNQIIAIRECKEKDRQSFLKSRLDFCIPSGVFSTRDSQVLLKDKMKEASGILSLDVDNYSGDYNKLKEVIRTDEFVAAVFDSPRNKLKIFVFVPPEMDNDLFWRRWVEACTFFGKRWGCEFDELKDITRACFVSWDSNAHYNGNAKVFEDIADADVFREKIKPVKYDVLTKGVEKDFRNNALFVLGCSLMHKKIEPSYIEVLLKTANKKNRPPLTETELQQIFTNIFKYKKKESEAEKREKVLPEVLLPQENKTLVTDFIEDLGKLLKDTDLFYRVADTAIIEIIDGKMKIVTPTRLISLIEDVCVPGIKRWKSEAEGSGYWLFHKKTASEQVCKIVLTAPNFYNKLKRIEKMLSVPIPILKDGQILFPKKQYNPDLKLYLDVNAPELTKPNMDILEAKEILNGLFKEFCFKDDGEEDKAKAMLGLLTPYLRGLYNDWYSRTPVFVYFANRERAGKDYLATIRILIFEGNATEEPPISTGRKDGGSNDELRKKFLSVLIKGKQFMHFSNNKGYINNSVFEQFATAKVYEDRILGKNDIVAFNNNIELSLSANTGTTMTADLGHRSIVTNLFLGMEDINKRKFDRPNLHQEIMRDRGLILSALYRLVMNWYDKGMPNGSELFTSFPEWAKISCGIIECAGWVNPLKNVKVDEVGVDDETADMSALFEYMHENHADTPKSKKEIREILIGDEDFGSSVFGWLDLEARTGQIKFGYLMDKYSGREFNGIVMKRDTTVKRKSRQKIRFVSIEIDTTKQEELEK